MRCFFFDSILVAAAVDGACCGEHLWPPSTIDYHHYIRLWCLEYRSIVGGIFFLGSATIDHRLRCGPSAEGPSVARR
uniref:Putative secreted protein n=1 Tax=Anopheles darlingi TaxID=43151 RepID=A0A2M4DII5_ANODA